MKEKEALMAKFSSEPKEYYQVELFASEGFTRKGCIRCGKYFWTLDAERLKCPEPPCQLYEFLGEPPTRRRLGYAEAWQEIEAFFGRNGHTTVKRYPVVCRWRPDLFFTVASIIDFQRIEGGKVVFELPANPLIVPQMCLRFNDIPKVGVTGKHYTSFCMVGQQSVAGHNGYWKDRCVELDFKLLTGPFEIRPEEITFVEDAWLGYGAFGPSLEYYVRGLELGNAVFTTFEGSPSSYRRMEEGVVDMGAGLERLAWITQGTPSSYDCVFGPVFERLIRDLGIDYDRDFLLRYMKALSALVENGSADTALGSVKGLLAKELRLPAKTVEEKTSRLEALYALLDHARSLVFAIADGGLPSNVGGGYNLRVILRRALGLIERFRWGIRLEDVMCWHIDHLKGMYPELEEHRDEIATILQVEDGKYRATRERAGKVVGNLMRAKRALTEEDLIRLYDSEGITPELLKEHGLQVEVPPEFYIKVTARHEGHRREEEGPKFDIEGLEPTRLLFYEDQNLFEFSAKVEKVLDNSCVVLDRTAFYARAGGQEPDLGWIGGREVVDVEKHGNIVLHKVKECTLAEGQSVLCKVDAQRREAIMRHHTATHILNGAARRVLGPWVWQHSAFKDIDKARLDITHYSHLTSEEVSKIEVLANSVARMNLPVTIEYLPRSEAERRYGFRLYQGGVAPSRELRIVNIEGFDVEACGGTHCSRTGDIGLIKVLRSERVQDGVERLEFMAGETAMSFIQRQESLLMEVSGSLDAQAEKVVEAVKNLKAGYEGARRGQRAILRRFLPMICKGISDLAERVDGIRLYVSLEEGLDEAFHAAVGERGIALDPSLTYLAFMVQDKAVRIMAFSGSNAQALGVRADELVKRVAKVLGGSGGGDSRFGQGGGDLIEKLEEAKRSAAEAVRTLSRSGRLKR